MFRTLGLAALAWATATHADPLPICAQPEVIQLVDEGIARQVPGSVREPGAVAQVPTDDPRIVRCGVRFSTPFLDTDHFGYAVQFRPGVYEYDVRVGRNALFVSAANLRQ